MRLPIDLDLLQLVNALSNPSARTEITLKRRDSLALDLQFGRNGIPELLPDGTTITFGLKTQGAYASGYLVSTSTFPAPASASGYYSGNPSLNTTELNDAFADASEPATLTLMGEVSFSTAGAITSTQTFSVIVQNDVIRGDEGVPTSGSPAFPAAANIQTRDEKGQPDGYAELDGDGLVPVEQLPVGYTGTLPDTEFLPTVTSLAQFKAVVTTARDANNLVSWITPDGQLATYVMDISGDPTSSEDPPTIVRPDDYNGSTNVKNWAFLHLVEVIGSPNDRGTQEVRQAIFAKGGVNLYGSALTLFGAAIGSTVNATSASPAIAVTARRWRNTYGSAGTVTATLPAISSGVVDTSKVASGDEKWLINAGVGPVNVMASDTVTLVVRLEVGESALIMAEASAVTWRAIKFAVAADSGTTTNSATTGSVTLDARLTQTFDCVLTGNSTLTLSNLPTGRTALIRVAQDATGSRTLAWSGTIKWPGGTAPVQTATASHADLYAITSFGGTLSGVRSGADLS